MYDQKRKGGVCIGRERRGEAGRGVVVGAKDTEDTLYIRLFLPESWAK